MNITVVLINNQILQIEINLKFRKSYLLISDFSSQKSQSILHLIFDAVYNLIFLLLGRILKILVRYCFITF